MAGIHSVETKPGSSAKSTSALNCRALSPVLPNEFKVKIRTITMPAFALVFIIKQLMMYHNLKKKKMAFRLAENSAV